MKTPTPEEFLRSKKIYVGSNVADENAPENYFRLQNLLSEYAEALYKDRIEKAGESLPKNAEWLDWYLKNKIATSDTASAHTFEWMKEKASVVIAKLQDDLLMQGNRLYDMAIELEQKDKEIEELKQCIVNLLPKINTNKP